jgi:RNA polymerase sigma-70 factor (ECF subfamily)
MDATHETEREPDLIARARAGDRGAFTALLRRHQRRVRVFIGGYVRDPAVVDDIAQEVFFSAYRRLGTFSGDVPLASWLLGIARKQTLHTLRGELRAQAKHGASLAAEITMWALEAAEARDDMEARRREIERLTACLDELAPTSARVVTDHYFRGTTLSSIARALGKQEGALKVMLFRVRKALRECMRRGAAVAAAEGVP